MTALASFATPIRALVVGASGGIGGALAALLAADPGVNQVIATGRGPPPHTGGKTTWRTLDLTEETSIVSALAGIDHLDLVIVATGMLHNAEGLSPEKTWRALHRDALALAFLINAIGPALVAKHTLPLLPRHGRTVFAALSARVGSIGDNRLGGWYGYRAAKAALNQILRTLSIELASKRHLGICVGLHPGTVATSLSAPFRGNVAADRLFTPEVSAAHLLRVIDGLQAEHSGQVLAWDGTVIDP